MESEYPTFERLRLAVNVLAQHADFPGKRVVMADCMADIENRWTQGVLTLAQRHELYAILFTAQLRCDFSATSRAIARARPFPLS